MKPKRAGRSVTAATIAIRTVIADEMLKPFRKPIRKTSSPSRAMHTVPPAKSTARPAVLRARTAASSGGRPALRPSRCRVTMNSA